MKVKHISVAFLKILILNSQVNIKTRKISTAKPKVTSYLPKDSQQTSKPRATKRTPKNRICSQNKVYIENSDFDIFHKSS